jgi:hypothetical protein
MDLIVVYGAAQEDEKDFFIRTCASLYSRKLTTYGCGFNIIRSPQEKNNDKYNDK